MTNPPVRSMTGFGTSEARGDTLSVSVEVRTVNNRHLKVTTRLPALIEPLARDVEELAKERLTRGTVWIAVNVSRASGNAPGRIVSSVLADYALQFAEAAALLGRDEPPPLDALLRLPGVVEAEGEHTLDDAERDLTLGAVREALGSLTAMREAEGAILVDALGELIDGMERDALRVEERVPVALLEHRDRLRERLNALLEGATAVPDEFLAREVALLADKSDVAEEVQRLRSHVTQVRDTLATGGPVGRRLDFLAQELGREANTIGSKSSDVELARAVIDLKLAVERLKEQAANLE